MSLVNRFVSIFRAKVNTVLDELEDPKEGLEYSLVEMREQVNKIRKSIVDVSLIKKKSEGVNA
jgi:phage shock protein A